MSIIINRCFNVGQMDGVDPFGCLDVYIGVSVTGVCFSLFHSQRASYDDAAVTLAGSLKG